MSYEIEGKIVKIYETQQVTDTFKKREIVIETDDTFPQFPKFEFKQDKTNLLNAYNLGDTVKIGFNVNGRSYQDKKTNETKYFNQLQGWRIEIMETATADPFPAADGPKEEKTNMSDDLPF